MSLIVRLIGILLLSAGLAGLTYTTNLFDGVIATTQASFKMYPMSIDPPELKISDYLKNRIQTVHPDTRIPVIIELTVCRLMTSGYRLQPTTLLTCSLEQSQQSMLRK